MKITQPTPDDFAEQIVKNIDGLLTFSMLKMFGLDCAKHLVTKDVVFARRFTLLLLRVCIQKNRGFGGVIPFARSLSEHPATVDFSRLTDLDDVDNDRAYVRRVMDLWILSDIDDAAVASVCDQLRDFGVDAGRILLLDKGLGFARELVLHLHKLRAHRSKTDPSKFAKWVIANRFLIDAFEFEDPTLEFLDDMPENEWKKHLEDSIELYKNTRVK